MDITALAAATGFGARLRLYRQGILILTLAVAALAPMSGCERSPAPPMRIGTNVWVGYEPLYLARDLGYLGDDYRLVEHTSASGVIRDFRNLALDAAALTLDEVLQLVQDDMAVRIALVMDVSDGGDVIIAHPPIADMADLKNRRVAVEDSALGAYVLTRALEIADLEATDITSVSRTLNEHEAAYLEGEVDAVVTFEPVRSRLVEAGGRIVFDSSQIPGEIVDVLIVSADYWDRNTGRVQELLRHWFRAVDYLRTQPDDAARRMAPRLKLEPTQVLASYQGLRLPDVAENRTLLLGDAGKPGLLASAEILSNVMVEHQLLRHAPSLASLFPSTRQWLPEDQQR